MKLNYRKWLVCGLLAVTALLSAGSLFAQDEGGRPPGGGPGGPGGDNGGQRRWRGGDPAQMQQRIMESIQDQLGFTNDTEWSAVQPLVQKVLEVQRDLRGAGMSRLFRGGNRGGGNNNRNRGGGFFGQPSAEYTALSDALDQNAPAGQVKDLLAKYEASIKAKRDKLAQAQADLRAVLSSHQEAEATLLGLLE